MEAKINPANRKVSVFLIGIGLLITSYLSYLKLADQASVCLSGGMINCEAVLNSRFSEISIFDVSIPIAYLGWMVYALLLLLWYGERSSHTAELPISLYFGLNAFAWLYSMYLVHLQFFVLRAACPWCLAHEANITILFGLTMFRVRQYLSVSGVSD